MKRIQKILFVVVLLIVSNLIMIVQGYNVNVGDTFDYDLVAAKEDLVLGNTIANFTGIRIDFKNLPESSQFQFNISSLYPNSYSIERIIADSQDKLLFQNDDFLDTIDFLILYPYYMANSFLFYRQALIDYYNVGIELICHPLIPTDGILWRNVKEMLTTYENDFLAFFGENSSIENFAFQAKENSDYKQIEVFIKGYFNSSENTKLTFVNSFRFAYSTKSGVLLGSRIKGDVKGLVDDDIINLAVDLYFEMTSFDLGSFEIGDFATGNSTGMTAICFVGSLFITFYIHTKRKKKIIAINR